MPVDLTELRELEAKATKGPWEAILTDDPRGRPSLAHMGVVAVVQLDPAMKSYHAVWNNSPAMPVQWPVNTKLIAAMRNALPYLIEELEMLRGKLEAIQNVVSLQAEDEGIWFDAETAPEALVQRELRKLHAFIEDDVE
jgi:hypothetical protein